MKGIQALLLPAIFVLTACGGGSGGDGAAEQPDFACARVMDPAELGITLGLTNNANIWLNPNGTTPLSARLQFCTPEPGTVTLTVLGKAPDITDGNLNDDMCSAANPDGIAISHQFSESASEFDLPVLGLYPNHNNTVVVEFIADSGATARDELMIMTAPLPINAGPPKFPLEIEIESNDLPADDAGVYMFSSQKAAFDQCGEVRWLYYGGGGLAGQFYEHLADGNWLASVNQDQISYHFRGFAEFTMLGQQVDDYEYTLPFYGHHEIQKLPLSKGGNYLVGSNIGLIAIAPDGVTQEDTVVEISAVTGLVVKTWDFNTILDPARMPIDATNDNLEDWLHLNSAVYDASDDSIVITAQRQSLVAKIDYETGALIWVIASPVGWAPEFQDKLLRPVDALGNDVDVNANYFWPYGPHAALVFPGRPGVVAVFDNGLERGIYGDRMPTGAVDDQDFSRGVEYQVDVNNMTVEIVWQFDWDQRVYNQITGDIDYLANGNYLLGFVGRGPYTDNPRVIEVDADGNILFNALANRGENQYRVEKIDLYQGQ